MVERLELKVSRFMQVFSLVTAVVVMTLAVNAFVATVQLAGESDATWMERASPFAVVILAGYLIWALWWRFLPELRPMAELAISEDELVVDAPPFLREPLRVPREHVRAGVIDQPRRPVRQGPGTLSAATIAAETSEGFAIAGLVLHSSWPNLVLFFEPAVELPDRRLRGRLLFPRHVDALFAQVADPARAASLFAPWSLPRPHRTALDKLRPARRVRIALRAKFDLLALTTTGSFACLAILGVWADGWL